MNDSTDSNELYTIRNQFYTGQYSKVKGHAIEQFSAAGKLKVLEFQVRSMVATGEDASLLIDEAKNDAPEDHEQVFHVLQAWNDLKAFGTDESTYFDDVSEPEFETQAVLTALYLVQLHKDVELAIDILTSFTSRATDHAPELEPYLLLIQLHLYNENFTEATKIYQRFSELPFGARDDIVYQVAESWINSIKGQSDNISNAYYFYDELLQADLDEDAQGKFHVLSVLFVMTLQLKHYPEAKELLDQISALDYKGTGTADLIANRITYEYLTNGGNDVVSLLRELAAADPEHHLLEDLKEKSERFDAIIEKYQSV